MRTIMSFAGIAAQENEFGKPSGGSKGSPVFWNTYAHSSQLPLSHLASATDFSSTTKVCRRAATFLHNGEVARSNLEIPGYKDSGSRKRMGLAPEESSSPFAVLIRDRIRQATENTQLIPTTAHISISTIPCLLLR